MSITDDDINYLVYRYLQESGMVHTAYTFGIESKVSKADIVHEDIEVGCLIKVIQRGLQYMELEANVDSQAFEVLTAADILKAKSTDELRQIVRERREDRAGSEEKSPPKPFAQAAVRKVTNAEAFGCPWSPDGTKLATYVHENTAHIWSAGCTLEYNEHSDMQAANLAHGQATQSSESVIVTQLVWAPDGRSVTTGCSDGTICTWASDGLLSAGSFVSASKVHTDQISHLSYSGDGQMLLASSADRPAMLWAPQLETRLGDLPGISEPINCASWCGVNLASTDARFEIHLHRATQAAGELAEIERLRTWRGHTDCVVAVDWAPNQWLLASCSEDRSVRLWGTHQTGELCSLIDDQLSGDEAVAHGDETSACVFRPAGPGSRNTNLDLQLASACQQGLVKLWDCEGGGLLHTMQGHACRVYACAWSPEGGKLATGCMNGAVVIWDVHNATPIKQHQTGTGVFDLQWNMDGYRISGAAKDGVYIWDLRV